MILADGVVVLRCHTTADAAEHLAGEDDDQVRWLSGGRGTPEGVARFIEDCQEQWRTGGPRRHLGIREAAGGRLVGNVEAHLALPGLAPGEVNLSYAVFPAWRGRGFAARAVGLVCAWLTTTPSLHTSAHTAVIRVDVDNTRSHGVPTAAGFTEVGTFPGGLLRPSDEPPMIRYEKRL